MEFAVGRASQRSTALSFNILEPKGTKWHWFKYATIIGNYLLMMFYTVISGWLLYYFVEMVKGRFQGLTSNEVANVFSDLLGNPNDMIVCSFVVIVVSFAICAIGLQKGVDRVTKIMMSLLFCLLIVLAVRSVMLPNAEIGLGYYLYPDFGTMQKNGVPECIFAAISTVIAVIENIVTHGMDLTGCSRKKSAAVNLVLLLLLPLPCVFGFNIWKSFEPLGSLVFLLFCTRRCGWGWDNFHKETAIGKGLPYPGFARKYISYILPIIVLVIFISGYLSLLK